MTACCAVHRNVASQAEDKTPSTIFQATEIQDTELDRSLALPRGMQCVAALPEKGVGSSHAVLVNETLVVRRVLN